MSQANLLASYARLLQQAAGAAQTASGIVLHADDLTNPSPEPYSSVRLHILEDGPGTLEGFVLVQNDVRVPVALADDWALIALKEGFRKAWGFSLKSQKPGRALAPLYDFQSSDNPSASIGSFCLELSGSRFWRQRKDGPDVWLLTNQLKLYFEGD